MQPGSLGDVLSSLWLTGNPLWWCTQTSGAWLERLAHVSTGEWITIALCLLFSALFSASETALTALSPAKVQQMLEAEPNKFGRLTLWLERPNRVLTTILIGNNLVNILASAMATEIANTISQSAGVAIAVGVMTLLILISGEIVPKTYAKYHSKQVAVRVFPLLRLAYLAFFPFTWILTKIASVSVQLFGGKAEHTGPFVSEADIEFMIDLGTREGVLGEEKEKLFQSILEFDDITIREVMVPRISMLSLSHDAPSEEVLELAHNSPHSRIPVYEEHLDNILGILYLRDLFRTYTTIAQSEQSSEWNRLLRPTYFVPGTMKISSLLGEFQKRKKHIAIVVDEFGGTMGMVTLEDILEEIVGEIHDEFDPDEEQELVEREDGVFLADAHISIRELEEHFSIEFPDDGDYETLGGFLTARFGHVPEVGDLIEWESYLFKITEADEKSVQQAEICQVVVDVEEAQARLNQTSPSMETRPDSEEKAV